MKYIKDVDYNYIINKYHDTSKPFDPFKRFIRHDEVFDKSTGMDPIEMENEILKNDERIQHMPHPMRKARAFEFILQNTRISCDCRDIFPNINSLDRLISRTLTDKWKKEVFEEIIPQIGQRRAFLEKNAICTIWPDYDHSVPYWDRLMDLGFKGILEESEKIRKNSTLTEKEEAFFEGIKITYEAVIMFVERLYNLASDTLGSEKQATALKNLISNPPSTFYECLLFTYIYFILSEHIEGLQVRAFSNFDRRLYKYYKNDLDNGKSIDELKTELAYFFMQFTAIGNYWNQPLFLGGCKKDESTEINELSYMFLDVYDQMGIYNPKIQIKVAKSTPEKFLKKALDMIRRGKNSIVFVNDATMRKALLRTKNVTEDMARECNITGCYEYGVAGGIGAGMNYMNLLKPLEYALHEGCDGITGHKSGLTSPKLEEYKTFDDLYSEYKRQLLHLCDNIIEVVNGFEDYLAYINPQSLLSATIKTSIENKKDAYEGGGIVNRSTICPGFAADIADSLTMIKKYVYDRKELSLREFVDILDKNYEGNEIFRMKLLSDKEKYGNDNEVPDNFVKEIVELISTYVKNKPTSKKRNGYWNACFHVARMSYTMADKTAAAPNGRKIGDELSKNISSTMGQNREGSTAAIRSALKIDATQFAGDACLDLGLLPSAVRGNDGLEAMYATLKTFMNGTTHALHINVFDADTLKDAQKNPQKYKDLQIRVCGWNVLWNNIEKSEQDGFIRQAESLV